MRLRNMALPQEAEYIKSEAATWECNWSLLMDGLMRVSDINKSLGNTFCRSPD